jgi:hypothetical protein
MGRDLERTVRQTLRQTLERLLHSKIRRVQNFDVRADDTIHAKREERLLYESLQALSGFAS